MLVAEKDRFPLSKVVLYDNEYERNAKIGEYGRILMSEYYPECEVVDTTDPETAFTGIDFAFMQIRAGRLKMRASDEHIALKHGCIGQETCGAGGFAYGMRSIPAVCDIIKDIRKYSPEAWSSTTPIPRRSSPRPPSASSPATSASSTSATCRLAS